MKAQSRVGANALLFLYYGDENGPEKLGGAAISMVIHFCSDIWRGYTPPAQNTQIHAVTYAPTLLWGNTHLFELSISKVLDLVINLSLISLQVRLQGVLDVLRTRHSVRLAYL